MKPPDDEDVLHVEREAVGDVSACKSPFTAASSAFLCSKRGSVRYVWRKVRGRQARREGRTLREWRDFYCGVGP